MHPTTKLHVTLAFWDHAALSSVQSKYVISSHGLH